MNPKYLFLIVSLVIFNNIFCSHLDKQAVLGTNDNLTTAIALPKQTSLKNNDAAVSPLLKKMEDSTFGQSTDSDQSGCSLAHQIEPHTEKPHAVPSNILTTMWYGVSKHVAGKTALAVFIELKENGILEADYQNNTSEAFHRLNEAASERFTKKDLLTPNKQQKIHNLFIASNEINPEFALAKGLAEKYYTLQKKALQDILEKQATQTEPQLRKIRNDIILQAETDYIEKLNGELAYAKNAASNARYLYKRAEIKEKNMHQNKTHYASIESFSKHLQTINSEVEIASDQNLYHLPTSKK